MVAAGGDGLRPWGTVRPPGGGEPIPCLREGDGRALALEARWPDLQTLIAAGPAAWAAEQERAERLLASGDAQLLDLSECEVLLPVAPRDFVDCYASEEHATFFGRLLRPDGDPLPPNWRSMPVAYHGRAGTVVVSGTPIARPFGQLGPDRVGPTERLDWECELGIVVAGGGRVAVDRAEQEIFGFVLLNDWSARDLQAWEMTPLGPFAGKSFATTISPWIVPAAALRRATPPAQQPPPPPYLRASEPWTVSVQIEVLLNGEHVAVCDPATLYWTPAQMLAHTTANGATRSPGDLIGTGTISGPGPGSLTEYSGGERWLADGDEVTFRAAPFGELRGTIVTGET